MKKRNQKENGQVIILLVAGIISLLGFTALAIDGARLYSERRHAQGTADTAVLTMLTYVGQFDASALSDPNDTSLWDAVDDDAEVAALERIYDNGYDDYALYDSMTGNDRLKMNVTQELGTMFDTYTAEIFLISEVDPVFAQLITDDELLVNVEAQAVLRLYTNLGFGQALYSLSSDACKAIDFDGGSDIKIVGSGIYANSSCTPNAINVTGTTDVIIDDNATTPGGFNNGGTGDITFPDGGIIDEGAPSNPIIPVPEPDCSSVGDGTVVSDGVSEVVFSPGNHNKINITCGTCNQTFLPGLYCLNDGMMVLNGNITAHDVTFYVPDDNISISGGEFSFIAPRAGQADDGTNSWDGMLFYLGDGKLDITGGENTYLEGTVYAPSDQFNPTCKLTGNGATEGYNLQFVCDTIGMSGTSDTLIEYDGTNAWVPPISIDLLQ